MLDRAMRGSARTLRRVAIGIAGGALLLAGGAMIVLPGPAIVAIPAGLGVLALEFEWAGRLRDAVLRRMRGCRARRDAGRREGPGAGSDRRADRQSSPEEDAAPDGRW